MSKADLVAELTRLAQHNATLTQKLTELGQEHNLWSLFENLYDAFALHELLYNKDGEPCDYLFVDVNPAYLKMAGKQRKDFVGKPSREVFQDHKPHWLEIYARVINGGEPARFEEYSRAQERHYEVLTYRIDGPRFACIYRDITGRKLAEAALRESEEQFGKFFHSNPAGIIITSLENGTVLDVNEAFVALTGHTHEDCVGSTSTDLDFWFDPSVRERATQKIIDEGSFTNLELKYRHKSGAARWGHFSADIIEVKGKRCVISALNDITDRKRAEEELKQSEATLQSILDVAPVGIGLTAGSDRILLWANEEMTKLLGYKHEDIRGRSSRILYQNEEEFRKAGKVLARANIGKVETELVRKDGSLMNAIVHSAHINPADNTSNTIVILVDTTAHKEAERAMQRRLEREKVESEISISLANCKSSELDNTITLALEKIGRFANARRSSLFSISRDQETVTNTHAWCANPNDPRWAKPQEAPYISFGYFYKRLREQLPVVISKLADLPQEAQAEREWHQKLGFRPLLLVPIGNRDQLYGALGLYGRCGEEVPWEADLIEVLNAVGDNIFRHLENKQLEAQIQQTQKLESLGVLAGGIAHDFNNLVTGILGNAVLALMDLPPEALVRKYIQDVETAARRAADLARQMLAYSGKGKFVVERLDLQTLVEEMFHLLKTSVAKKVAVHCQFTENTPPIEADATQVRQIVMNLIVNAAESIGDSSGEVFIRTSSQQCNSDYLNQGYLDDELPSGLYSYLEIADTGCGMDRETVQKIFDPFYTTKFTGRGLGLAAVLGIVRGHRGTIRVDSQPGEGTTIRVLFPATTGVSAEGEESQQQQQIREEDDVIVGKTVLLVDDEQTVRVVGREMLKRFGANAVVACDGEQALEIFKEAPKKIDCVLLDLTMPNLDGEETFREMVRIRKDVCVVLSSGYNQQESVARFTDKGLAGFIQKPYDPHQLRTALSNALKKSK